MDDNHIERNEGSRPDDGLDEIWMAVANLERQFYTKAEIARKLRTVADAVEPNHV